MLLAVRFRSKILTHVIVSLVLKASEHTRCWVRRPVREQEESLAGPVASQEPQAKWTDLNQKGKGLR